MTFAAAPAVPKAPRQRAIWDVVLTIILLVFSLGGLVTAGFFDLFIVAFTDYCPTACQANLGTAVAVVLTILIGSAVVVVVAAIVSIVLLVKRRRGWWVALIALLVVIAGAVAGIWSYAALTAG